MSCRCLAFELWISTATQCKQLSEDRLSHLQIVGPGKDVSQQFVLPFKAAH